MYNNDCCPKCDREKARFLLATVSLPEGTVHDLIRGSIAKGGTLVDIMCCLQRDFGITYNVANSILVEVLSTLLVQSDVVTLQQENSNLKLLINMLTETLADYK